MNNKKLAFAVAAICIAIDFITVFSVVLNLSWVRTHAAGGQYETFPTYIRGMYFFQALFALVVGWFAWKIRNGVKSQSDSNFALVIICIYAISTFSQIFSRTPSERWNAIPALLIVWAFTVLRKA